jgi:hypothetical protein
MTCTCKECGAIFRSHSKVVMDPVPFIMARRPCPGCGAHELRSARSDPESFTIKGSK